MPIFAYVENNEIKELTDGLPSNWRNYSNFSALENDLEFLSTIGWQRVEKIDPPYNPENQRLDNYKYKLLNGIVTFEPEIIDIIPPTPEEIAESIRIQNEEQWTQIRIQRDAKMRDFEWRIMRNQRQTFLGLPTTDNMTDLQTYMQALADITLQPDPFNVVWPVFS